MSSGKHFRKLVLMGFAFAALGVGVWAQEPPQEPQPPPEQPNPKPAGRGIPGVDDSTQNPEENNNQWNPDTNPVTGLQNPTLGTPEARHSYWVPGVEYATMIQSQPLGGNSGTNWYANTFLGGDLSLLKAWSRSQLGINYSGGGFFSGGGGQGNGSYQQFALSDSMVYNRWQFQIFDNLSYLPESAFGFLGGSPVGVPGVSGSLGVAVPGLGGGVIPNQSIYNANGPRVSNALGAQATYQVSRRGSITVAGTWAVLRFTQPGNVDNDMALGSIGYNYLLSKTDSIGVFYRFEGFHFTGQPEAIGTQNVSFAYSKKITQRFALSAYGGPQYTHYRVALAGNQTGSWNASLGASLSYGTERGAASVSYFYGSSGGGGILIGSLTNSVTGNLSRKLTRVWSGNVNVGFARNSPLQPGTSNLFPTFDDYYVGGGVIRPIGRTVNFALNYTAYIEHSNQTGCVGASCSANTTQNTITVSLQWHARPFILP